MKIENKNIIKNIKHNSVYPISRNSILIFSTYLGHCIQKVSIVITA